MKPWSPLSCLTSHLLFYIGFFCIASVLDDHFTNIFSKIKKYTDACSFPLPTPVSCGSANSKIPIDTPAALHRFAGHLLSQTSLFDIYLFLFIFFKFRLRVALTACIHSCSQDRQSRGMVTIFAAAQWQSSGCMPAGWCAVNGPRGSGLVYLWPGWSKSAVMTGFGQHAC